MAALPGPGDAPRDRGGPARSRPGGRGCAAGARFTGMFTHMNRPLHLCAWPRCALRSLAVRGPRPGPRWHTVPADSTTRGGPGSMGTWSKWEDFGGAILSAPSVASRTERPHKRGGGVRNEEPDRAPTGTATAPALRCATTATRWPCGSGASRCAPPGPEGCEPHGPGSSRRGVGSAVRWDGRGREDARPVHNRGCLTGHTEPGGCDHRPVSGLFSRR